MKLRPLGECVLVRLDDGEDDSRTRGGLIRVLPRMFRKGVVVSTGFGYWLPSVREGHDVHYFMDARPGDRVCFPAGVMDTSQGKAMWHKMPDGHVLIHERDILFIIEEGDPTVELV